MSSIACVLLVELPRVRRFYRRYGTTDLCSCTSNGRGYHNAMRLWDDVDVPVGEIIPFVDTKDVPADRFPAQCDACGYEFEDRDARQIFCERLYRADGAITTIREGPVGAMWWADWMEDHFLSAKAKARGGRQHLMVKTPGGDWDIDAPSSNGDGWDRTGDPPLITARPSILMPTYHGWLTNGMLTSC